MPKPGTEGGEVSGHYPEQPGEEETGPEGKAIPKGTSARSKGSEGRQEPPTIDLSTPSPTKTRKTPTGRQSSSTLRARTRHTPYGAARRALRNKRKSEDLSVEEGSDSVSTDPLKKKQKEDCLLYTSPSPRDS